MRRYGLNAFAFHIFSDGTPGISAGLGIIALSIATNTGYVGIGTAAPSYPLDVSGSFRAIGLINTGSRSYFSGVDGSANHWFSVSTTAVEPNGLFMGVHSTSGVVNGVNLSANSALGLLVLQSGEVAVGTYTPNTSYNFWVNGSAGGSNGWNVASDARLKKDVTPIANALALVEQLQGVRYRWRSPAEREVGKDMKLPLDQPQLGFLAHAVEKVAPEAVTAPKPGSRAFSDLIESWDSQIGGVLIQTACR